MWRLLVVEPARSVRLSRIGVRDMLSYQSLMPAGAGTPNWENRGYGLEHPVLPLPSPTRAGDKPPRYISAFRPQASDLSSAGFDNVEPA